MKNDDVSTNITLENFLIMRAQIWSTFESIDDLINNITNLSDTSFPQKKSWIISISQLKILPYEEVDPQSIDNYQILSKSIERIKNLIPDHLLSKTSEKINLEQVHQNIQKEIEQIKTSTSLLILENNYDKSQKLLNNAEQLFYNMKEKEQQVGKIVGEIAIEALPRIYQKYTKQLGATALLFGFIFFYLLAILIYYIFTTYETPTFYELQIGWFAGFLKISSLIFLVLVALSFLAYHTNKFLEAQRYFKQLELQITLLLGYNEYLKSHSQEDRQLLYHLAPNYFKGLPPLDSKGDTLQGIPIKDILEVIKVACEKNISLDK